MGKRPCLGYQIYPEEIQAQAICIDGDIGAVIEDLQHL